MESSPVLLLPPTATALMNTSTMNVMETRPSVVMAPTKASEPSVTAKPNLKLQYGLTESAGSAAMLATAPVTPAAATISLSTSATSSPGGVCSPRDPAAKLAHQMPKTSSSATALVTPLSTSSTLTPVVTPAVSPAATLSVNTVTSPASSAIQHQLPPHIGTTTTTKRVTSSAMTKASSPKPQKSNTGRWTEAEHKLFLKGLEQFPYRAWKKIATLIKSRTVVQIRTHAQKYYQKLEKEEQRMREREAQLAAQQGLAGHRAENSAPSTPACTSDVESPAPLNTVDSLSLSSMEDDEDESSSPSGKKRLVVRKRKCSSDDDSVPQSSLPKRMAKEKRCMREKTMSPKQKAVVSNSKVFGHVLCAELTGDPSSSMRASSAPRSTSGIKPNPLDLDESSTASMILDFADEKPLEYPFSLDTSLEQGLAGIENDELLQLTDDESMDWFTSDTQDDAADSSSSNTKKPTPVSSPLTLGRYLFSPLYTEDSLQFTDPTAASPVVTTDCSTPSPILSSSADCSDFSLSGDEDEDFVLDPEKFLSSYFSPNADDS